MRFYWCTYVGSSTVRHLAPWFDTELTKKKLLTYLCLICFDQQWKLIDTKGCFKINVICTLYDLPKENLYQKYYICKQQFLYVWGENRIISALIVIVSR